MRKLEYEESGTNIISDYYIWTIRILLGVDNIQD